MQAEEHNVVEDTPLQAVNLGATCTPGVGEKVGADFYEVGFAKRAFRAPKWPILEKAVEEGLEHARDKLNVLREVEDAETVFAARMARYMWLAEGSP